MIDIPLTDYRRWMRERFPVLNLGVDGGHYEDFQALTDEGFAVCVHIAIDKQSDLRERFTYISMLHSAFYLHRKKAVETGTKPPPNFEEYLHQIENAIYKFADDIGVEHRFLSSFYLMHNPEIPEMNGKFAQFRPNGFETAFLRINREGTLQYKQAALSLSTAAKQLFIGVFSSDEVGKLLDNAADAFRRISQGNAMLLRTPGGEEFAFLTKYFGEVRVAGGPPLRGVNAGDQAWSYIIDLLLGVNLKHVFETAFHGTPSERHYPSYVRTSADVIHYEFHSHEYLRSNYLLPEDYEFLISALDAIGNGEKALPEAIIAISSIEERATLSKKLLHVLKNYLAASDVHFELAKTFVPKDVSGEQIGSAGTNIKKFLLHGLNDERRKVLSAIENQISNK